MNKSFDVKDSGVRQDYPSGMRRDTQEGKPDYTLLPLEMLTRWAEHMTKDAEKYGRDNWQLANSKEELRRFKASAFRHLIQWLEGQDDEDHASAVLFNISAAEIVQDKLISKSMWDDASAKDCYKAIKGTADEEEQSCETCHNTNHIWCQILTCPVCGYTEAYPIEDNRSYVCRCGHDMTGWDK